MPESNNHSVNETDARTMNIWQRVLAMPSDSLPKTFLVASTLCLVASMVVSTAAVSLRPLQEANKLKDKQINILQVAGLYSPEADIADMFKQFEPRVLDIETGEFAEQFDPTVFDDRAAADDPALSRALDNDPASIGRQSRYKTVYLLRDDQNRLDKLILPIHGYGLWSTLYGFIAIEEDGNEIYGLQFYEHAETPGLGAEVDNPRWKSQWSGKKLREDSGELGITVAKVAPLAGADFHVDALAGATLTSVGVDNLVRFWMGEQGYSRLLNRLESGESL